MTGLRNINQENHDLKQELESAIGVLTTLEESIKNQSQQLKEMKDELKESKAREKDLRTTLMQANKNQSQELKDLQDELKENKNEFKELQDELKENKNELKDLQDEIKELKAREKAEENRKTLTGRTEINADAETNLVSTKYDVNYKTGKFTTPFDYLFYMD
ncbi:hypothetical protein CHS0354_033528 [Potamilus streckersoni]|uniref:Uncharacterized protein n=1 Tax=Potamilus streckersoni TaxID=2493646 RepID=A0AAE0S7L3_9BIVA|nr:hypothetical protein CHS0354_033528 [Potamilus streckersoni]